MSTWGIHLDQIQPPRKNLDRPKHFYPCTLATSMVCCSQWTEHMRNVDVAIWRIHIFTLLWGVESDPQTKLYSHQWGGRPQPVGGGVPPDKSNTVWLLWLWPWPDDLRQEFLLGTVVKTDCRESTYVICYLFSEILLLFTSPNSPRSSMATLTAQAFPI